MYATALSDQLREFYVKNASIPSFPLTVIRSTGNLPVLYVKYQESCLVHLASKTDHANYCPPTWQWFVWLLTFWQQTLFLWTSTVPSLDTDCQPVNQNITQSNSKTLLILMPNFRLWGSESWIKIWSSSRVNFVRNMSGISFTPI